jgi:hypothetical protein
VPIEEPLQTPQPPLAGLRLERGTEGFRVDEIEAIRCVDCPLQLPVSHEGGEVDQRRDDVCDGYAVDLGDLRRSEARAAVRHDASVSWPTPTGHGHVDPTRSLPDDSQQLAGAVMADGRGRAARQHRRHPAAVAGEVGSADGIDTTVD